MIDTPGIYNVSFEEYRADPVVQPSLSRSMISALLFTNPLYAWFKNPRLNPDYIEEEKPERFDIGTTCHSILLEGVDSVVVIEANDWRSKAAREERDKARQDGYLPLLPDQYEKAKNMVESAQKQIAECKELKINDLLKEGDSELTYVWEENGIWFRTRKDWVSNDRKLIVDYKTTGMSVNPESIARHIATMGYDIQEALYLRGVKAVNDIDAKFVFIFQEDYEPYLCSFIGLPPEFSRMGKSKVEYGIFLWEQCMKLGKWEGYPKKVCYPDAPAWALAHWESIAENISA